MKFKQGLFWKGYITVYVEGDRPENFLNRCIEADIPIWDVKRINEKKMELKLHLKHVSKVKKIRRRLGYKLTFKAKHGLPFLLAHLKFRKPLVIGVALCLFFIFLLSNIVMQVKIVGVTPETEYKIQQRLDHYGLKEGIFKFSLRNIDDMERNITNELKDVMWIGIEEKGTTYIVHGVEKSLVHLDDNQKPQHLIASKEGEITQMYVESGQPMVKVNQHVNKGDILVSGIIGQTENEEEDKDNNKNENVNQQQVHAKGKVFAETWYTTETIVPLKYKHDTLTGDKDQQYKMKFGKVKVPIWDIFEPDYENKYEEVEEKPLYFLNFKLPFTIEKKTIHESERIKGERTEKEAVQEGIEQAKRELKKHIGFDSEIIDVKILQQSKENDKVKLNLYFIVKENIAVAQPINQGD
ncbi:sporulation protein YqfD [Salirhabdus sp. Marseille-P4669]|uniref:sporulation protein YqfD n=1 Tax=Salirhabdus sp. Marseille-P4669 TaxID=2042310 RepID=UPI000C7B7AE5|nr:sporulation protein YqfD [Salirhabdus sp. Marseille-P4669]